MNAIVIGVVFSALTIGIGMSYIGLTLEQVLWTILCSFVTNFILLITLLSAEQKKSFKAIFSSTPRMWLLYWVLFHSSVWTFCPWMRDVKTTLILWIPLFFSGGFAALLFGPIQDRIVWARQKRERSSTRKT